MTKKETIAYIAGILDGEGYFGISISESSNGTPCYYSRVTVHMNKPEAIKIICDFFNTHVKNSTIGGKPYFSFYLSDTKKIISAIKTVLPYLTVKKEPAKIVLKLCQSRSVNKVKPLFIHGHFRGNTSLPKPIQDYHASLYHSLKQIQGYYSK